MASYPIVEAALMESVPASVRGRVFGLFITLGGLVGNTAHWLADGGCRRWEIQPDSPEGFYPIYGALALLMRLLPRGPAVPASHPEAGTHRGCAEACGSALRLPHFTHRMTLPITNLADLAAGGGRSTPSMVREACCRRQSGTTASSTLRPLLDDARP